MFADRDSIRTTESTPEDQQHNVASQLSRAQLDFGIGVLTHPPEGIGDTIVQLFRTHAYGLIRLEGFIEMLER